MCVICGYVYDEAEGAGRRTATRCALEGYSTVLVLPNCGSGKEDFDIVEV